MSALPSRDHLIVTHWRQLLVSIFVDLLTPVTTSASHQVRAGGGNIGFRSIRKRRDDAGMSTAEYAVGTVAAVGFAAVLYAVIHSPATRALLANVVSRALSIPF
ncbi:DUF4244 domain-containing protein [Frankia sp. Cr2]|uniref:DUF4244 domain-containing protein n=1 Tax=Frankia sp. Cr2 TaxID=3073932 RepID=UPI002AD34D74|nr:DUF4244 domain-containing protein [Frankia sp. Cr2]